MDVLREKSRDLMVPLEVVALVRRNLNGVELSLSGDHQFTNSGLAVALCKSWLQSTGNWEKLFQHSGQEDSLPDTFLRGLQTSHLSGRAEIAHDSALPPSSGDLLFYLDGAHSPESIEACARWFSSVVKEKTSKKVWGNGDVKFELKKTSKKILLLNFMDVRDPQSLLPILLDTCASSGTNFSKTIFSPGISTYTPQSFLQRYLPRIYLGSSTFREFEKTSFMENMPLTRILRRGCQILFHHAGFLITMQPVAALWYLLCR